MTGRRPSLSERPGYFLAPEAFRASIPAFHPFHLPVFKNKTKRPRLKNTAVGAGRQDKTQCPVLTGLHPVPEAGKIRYIARGEAKNFF
jgi:hypothetical protein